VAQEEGEGGMRPVYLALLIWFQFAIVTVNYRAIAQARYVAAALTDGVIAICGFTLFKMIAASDTPYDIAGYAVGAMLGGITGIYLTRQWVPDA
jgi:hypothetical protein